MPYISIHALLAESDGDKSLIGKVNRQFQSTLSLRRATWRVSHLPLCARFQSTLSLRRATACSGRCFSISSISIHALLAESDTKLRTIGKLLDISIHALLAESDDTGFVLLASPRANFNPRSPCGERHLDEDDMFPVIKFQSTLSLRRATAWAVVLAAVAIEFQSTLSLRRATSPSRVYRLGGGISIHALLAESDHSSDKEEDKNEEFQSTLSLRRATPDRFAQDLRTWSISIHALLAESDLPLRPRSRHRRRFQSTLSLRRATRISPWTVTHWIFQSTLSLRRATLTVMDRLEVLHISIHALLAESDPLPS